MRLGNLHISGDIASKKGIKEINLTNLSNIVALLGKNGSGKTRILDLIDDQLSGNILLADFLNGNITGLSKQMQDHLNDLMPHKDFLILTEQLDTITRIPNWNSDQEIRNKAAKLRQEIKALSLRNPNLINIQMIRDGFIESIRPFRKKYYRRVHNKEINDLNIAFKENSKDFVSFEDLVEIITDHINVDEFSSIHKSALDYFTKLPHKLVSDKIESHLASKDFKECASYKKFLLLKDYINKFLNKELNWEIKDVSHQLNSSSVVTTQSGFWTLDKYEFNYTTFSDGEKILFAYALLFFLMENNPNLTISECIIILDEPELHLHADSEIDLLDRLISAIGNKGQLIFATHSINILSILKYNEVFIVKDGEITYAGKESLIFSLRELLRLDDRIIRMGDFLSSMANWSFINFIKECFYNPEVIEKSKKGDPQIEAFKSLVLKLDHEQVRFLLDFGAGKGRVFEQIKEENEYTKNIEYEALEPDINNHENLKNLGLKSILTDYTQLEESRYDLILLCNVLHELPILNWVEIINKIIKSLTKDGYLMIIEPKLLIHGEKIGIHGFFVLENEEFKALFSSDKIKEIIIHGKENSLTAIYISKQNLNYISIENVIAALDLLKNRSYHKIRELRNTSEEGQIKSYAFGRKNAFLSQQFLNCFTALDDLSKSSPL